MAVIKYDKIGRYSLVGSVSKCMMDHFLIKFDYKDSEVSESRKFLRKRKKLKLEVTKLLNHEPVSPDQK